MTATASDGDQGPRQSSGGQPLSQPPKPPNQCSGSWAVRCSRSQISDAMVLIGIQDATPHEASEAADELDRLRHEGHQDGCQCQRCPGLRRIAACVPHEAFFEADVG